MKSQLYLDDNCRQMLNNGRSYTEIQDILHIGPRRIHAISSGIQINHKRGRPAVLTNEMIDFIETNSLLNACFTDKEITDMLNAKFHSNISSRTIARKRKDLGFIYRPPMTIQALSEEQKQLRVQFCQWILENQEKIPNIVFSDECRFQKGPDNSWRRIKRGAWNETCFVQKEKFYTGIMIWGAIGPHFKSKLVVCTNKEDSEEYKRILLESEMISKCDALYGQYKWSFMQDGAPCHTARATMEWLKSKVLIVPGWPPNSPDLNPIELIWAIIKKKLKKKMWRREDDLYSFVEEIWNSIDENTINSLVEDFVRRCRIVLDLGGNSASQYVSSHKNNVDEKDRIIDVSNQSWTVEEDKRLVRLQREYGNKWTVIGQLLNRSRNSVKNRFKMLMQLGNNEKLANKCQFPSIQTLDDLIADDLREAFQNPNCWEFWTKYGSF